MQNAMHAFSKLFSCDQTNNNNSQTKFFVTFVVLSAFVFLSCDCFLMAISSSCHVTCSLTAISSSCHLLPSAWWSLCTQCSCIWKCAVQCSCLWKCTIFNTVASAHSSCDNGRLSIYPGLFLTFASPFLLTALNLSLHSDKWWTSVSKALCYTF